MTYAGAEYFCDREEETSPHDSCHPYNLKT